MNEHNEQRLINVLAGAVVAAIGLSLVLLPYFAVVALLLRWWP